MRAYRLSPEDIKLSTSVTNKTFPLMFSANPVRDSGSPYGIVSVDGKVYNSMPEGLPVMLGYPEGDVEIRENIDLPSLAFARFAISGSMLLLSKGEKVKLDSPISTCNKETVDRIGIATLPNGEVFVVKNRCTTEELQDTLYVYGAYDAMMGAFGNTYLYNPRGGEVSGESPLAVLYTSTYEELPRPVVVIDAEKEGRIIQKHLSENYVGTFLLSQNDGNNISKKEMHSLLTSLNADFLFSVRNNMADGTEFGYESMIDKRASEMTKNVQSEVHGEVVRILSPYGVFDRGKKTSKLSDTPCPVLMSYVLFSDNEEDIKILKNSYVMEEVYKAHARGLASGLGLTPQVSLGTTSKGIPTYRVCVGSYTFKAGAEEMLKTLRDAGIDGYIVRQ